MSDFFNFLNVMNTMDNNYQILQLKKQIDNQQPKLNVIDPKAIPNSEILINLRKIDKNMINLRQEIDNLERFFYVCIVLFCSSLLMILAIK